MSLRRPLDRAIVGLQTAAQYLNESSAPLHTYGADEVPSLLNQSLTDIKNAVDQGPPLSLDDLVRACLQCTMIPYRTYQLTLLLASVPQCCDPSRWHNRRSQASRMCSLVSDACIRDRILVFS